MDARNDHQVGLRLTVAKGNRTRAHDQYQAGRARVCLQTEAQVFGHPWMAVHCLGSHEQAPVGNFVAVPVVGKPCEVGALHVLTAPPTSRIFPQYPDSDRQIAKDLINLTPPVERAILVGAPLKRSNDRRAVDEHLEELGRLADTAGARVVGTLTQSLDRPDASTYIGRGKVEELKAMMTEREATVVIFDDELTPAQGKNLEGELGKRVIDRAELILDIFALRARSAEARMQVELAQLEYSLPRLRNLWTHLEKFRGGIGVRGPGETQLETDRRLVGLRITALKRRLQEVERSRVEQRKTRKKAFRVSLVGYTNAGKSSILKALAGGDVFVEDRLFATLDPLTREVSLAGKDSGQASVLLTDTVGFIRKLPHDLVASFRATLEEVREADLLLHVIDASNPSWEEQRLVVDAVLADLGVHDKRTLHVFNKTDRLDTEHAQALSARMQNLLPNSVLVSAVATGGLESLRAALITALRADRPAIRLCVPASDGKLLAEIHRNAQVVESANDEATGDVLLTVRADDADRARWAQWLANGKPT